ncbi:MAG: flagellar hook capping FlgD N-terminal domain-containing protein [Betaproteobacteria bacterium]
MATTALYTNAASVNPSSAAARKLPSGIQSYEEELAKPKANNATANQQDFLKLFTTQLQNQNPLDPTKNEAFVAQLAQFSQLEATTNMATQLTALTASIQGDRMMSGAALIGKSVVVPGNGFELKAGQPVRASIDLPNGADGLQIDVLNGSGQAVYQQILGPQQAGSFQVSWAGQDMNGQDQPDGAYRFRVTAVAQGKNISPTVSTFSTIRSVSQDSTGEMLVQVQGGQTMKLADVKRIGG